MKHERLSEGREAGMRRDRLLVIGAGPVGLGMASALKAHGIAYDQVDANDGVGGLWRHTVYKTAHIVSSKRSTAFADFPMPADYPDFPSAGQMLAYLEDFAVRRGLLAHIETGKKVQRAFPLHDHSWHVMFEDGEQRIYKGVVVCNGHHWHKRMPTYPGAFAGRIMHSKDYREPADLAGRRVLVIGGGNSACDIACEAARVGRSCHLSLRSGYWFLPKTAFGRPLSDLPIWGLPVWLQRLILRAIIRIVIGDYRDYGLPRPNHKIFERHPTYGTDLLNYIRLGRIKPRVEIDRYDGSIVRFKDGSTGEYDLIVAGTGYHNSFPFLPKGLLRVENEAVQVYGGAFPDNVKNLYIVGWVQARNGFGSLLTPAADLYARLIRMQDELQPPLGAILRELNEPLPTSQIVDPGQARRQIWLGHRLLWLVRWKGRRMARNRHEVTIPADERFKFEAGATSLPVN
ncbi:MAG TPA: NAD(P)-binding domain-containing protein [Hyphomicrobiaceae bacterium]|nr:NAD(P)-binding domain-containing protein [Hyphomicrobiaceae bacterium]